MNADRKAEWVTALRSGEYEQGYGSLATVPINGGPTRYCCLGVACELAAKAGVEIAVQGPDNLRNLVYDDHTTSLPLSVQQWLGIDDDYPEVFRSGSITTLADINDSGIPFVEIANIIEEQL